MSERINICILVGNGFDMAAGLDTSTFRFVKRFAEQHRDDDSPAGRLARQIGLDGPENWADFERKLGEYASSVGGLVGDEKSIGEYVDAKSAIDDDLLAFVREREDLVDLDKVRDASDVCLASICGWLGALTPRDRKRFLREFNSPYTFDVSFVTLNYTNVLDMMVEQQGPSQRSVSIDYVSGYRLCKLVHAHGDLANNPICGVDNPSQICSDMLAADEGVLETVVKGSTQEMLGSLDDENALALIDAAEVIMVYGSSMGETDARWWRAVIDRLKSATSKRFVVLFGYRFERSGRSAAKIREEITQIKERLFTSAGMENDEEKRELLDKIFVLSSDSIFEMPGALVADIA